MLVSILTKNRHVCDGFFILIAFIGLLFFASAFIIASAFTVGTAALHVLLVDAVVEVERERAPVPSAGVVLPEPVAPRLTAMAA